MFLFSDHIGSAGWRGFVPVYGVVDDAAVRNQACDECNSVGRRVHYPRPLRRRTNRSSQVQKVTFNKKVDACSHDSRTVKAVIAQTSGGKKNGIVNK